jgi:hypothetical protein
VSGVLKCEGSGLGLLHTRTYCGNVMDLKSVLKIEAESSVETVVISNRLRHVEEYCNSELPLHHSHFYIYIYIYVFTYIICMHCLRYLCMYRVIKKSVIFMITAQKTGKNILNSFNHLPL